MERSLSLKLTPGLATFATTVTIKEIKTINGNPTLVNLSGDVLRGQSNPSTDAYGDENSIGQVTAPYPDNDPYPDIDLTFDWEKPMLVNVTVPANTAYYVVVSGATQQSLGSYDLVVMLQKRNGAPTRAHASYDPELNPDGDKVLVDYSIEGSVLDGFYVNAYASTNGTTWDENDQWLFGDFIDDSELLTEGDHTIALTPYFSNDPQEDYYLVVKLDATGLIAETDENDNTVVFEGGAFLDRGNGVLHVHGAPDYSAESVGVGVSSGVFDVQVGQTVSWSYDAGDVYEVHVRTHDGADVVETLYGHSLSVPLWAFGGPGGDTLRGGSGGDYLRGGDGVDHLHGLGGNDTLYGDANTDDLHGGDDVDTLRGGDDPDYLYGDAGDDYLYGDESLGEDEGEGDVLEGGTGDDYLAGGYGTDVYRFTGSSDLGADELYDSHGDDDTLDFGGLAGGVTVDLGDASPETAYGLLDLTLLNPGAIENVLGTAYWDELHGNDLDNYLSGGAGSDLLEGGYGEDEPDYLNGDGGNAFPYNDADDAYCPGREDWLSSRRVAPARHASQPASAGRAMLSTTA